MESTPVTNNSDNKPESCKLHKSAGPIASLLISTALLTLLVVLFARGFESQTRERQVQMPHVSHSIAKSVPAMRI